MAPQRAPNRLTRVFLAAAVEAGHALNSDFNSAVQEGVKCYEVTQKSGERWSVARAYLRTVLQRRNRTVLTGVDYLRRGRVVSAEARRGVLVSAGALKSPPIGAAVGHRRQLPAAHNLTGTAVKDLCKRAIFEPPALHCLHSS